MKNIISNTFKVKLIQYKLGIVIDGVFGKKSTEALINWQKNSGLTFKTLGELTDEEFDVNFSENVVTPAYIKKSSGYVGIKEDDIDGDGKTDNRSTIIDKFILTCFPKFNVKDKTAKGFAWCACFVSYVLKETFNYKFTSASAREWLNHAKNNGVELKSARDFKENFVYIGGWVNPDGTGHVYLIDPIDTFKNNLSLETVRTIEGNTNDGGSREGDGVYRRSRVVGKNMFFGIKI